MRQRSEAGDRDDDPFGQPERKLSRGTALQKDGKFVAADPGEEDVVRLQDAQPVGDDLPLRGRSPSRQTAERGRMAMAALPRRGRERVAGAMATLRGLRCDRGDCGEHLALRIGFADKADRPPFERLRSRLLVEIAADEQRRDVPALA